ncbi:MAG: hypothetical protein AAGL49_13610 [Pseudomonadota bacterium]
MANGGVITDKSGKTVKPSVLVDYERYAHFLNDSDLSEDHKRELLWAIIFEFVSLGFGVHPLQQAQNPCGKLEQNPPKSALTAPLVVDYARQYLDENFEMVSDLETEPETEGVE